MDMTTKATQDTAAGVPDPKGFYNDTMPRKFGDDYEGKRWHGDAVLEAGYDMTLATIRHHLFSVDLPPDVHRIVEVGPGVGTWTKPLLAHFSESGFDLLDISSEMLRRARTVLPFERDIRMIESDLLAWTPSEKYALLFSCRAIEYIQDKAAVVRAFRDAIAPGGYGFVITKMPHYTRHRWLGQKLSVFHQWQAPPDVITPLLSEAGFTDIVVHPATMSVPFFHSAALNRFMHTLFGNTRMGPFIGFFAESYAIRFRKKRKGEV